MNIPSEVSLDTGMVKDGITLGQGKCIGCHHLTVQPCTSLCFVLFCFNPWNFRGLMGFHQIWKLHQETQRQLQGGWVGKTKRKKKIQFHVPSWNNRLTSEHFQMKIFFPIIFDVACWTSLWRLKSQRKMSYKEEKMTYSHHKLEQKKHP